MAVYTTIDDPEAYFQVKIWTGTGSSNALTLDGDTDMQPDLVWIKSRSDAQNNIVTDSVRGTNKNIYSDSQSAEATTTDNITAFGSDGFTVAGAGNETNGSLKTYVAWCWKESATAGFDIGTYTGNATDDTDISHSLSAVPEFIVCKNRPTTGKSFYTFHASLGNGKAVWLEDTSGSGTSTTYWSDESPTSSVFTLGNSSGHNASSDAHIFYAWAGKQGFSKFGSYTGTGSADGPYIHLGFRPALVIMKETTDSSTNWVTYDNKRNPGNPVNLSLYPNLSNAEGDASLDYDFCSNGFKVRTSNSGINADGDNYIYIAFAEAPFVNSNGVPGNAR